ncbi:hypothetical protein GS500_04230 [Rhodococcus hoagii]|nr:hypothetical protein [Prescottella equi]
MRGPDAVTDGRLDLERLDRYRRMLREKRMGGVSRRRPAGRKRTAADKAITRDIKPCIASAGAETETRIPRETEGLHDHHLDNPPDATPTATPSPDPAAAFDTAAERRSRRRAAPRSCVVSTACRYSPSTRRRARRVRAATRCHIGEPRTALSGPCAVLPQYQRTGAASAAIRAVLDAAKQRGEHS